MTHHQTPLQVLVGYRVTEDGAGWWLEIEADGRLYERIGPFDVRSQVDSAIADLRAVCRPIEGVA